MNDRFRFRVWNIENSRYARFNYLNLREYLTLPNRYIVEQCSGVKDQNGKLIYEGDIVRFYALTYEVYFQERNSAIKIWNEKKQIGHSLGYHEEFEVIGNIHENPELLDQK